VAQSHTPQDCCVRFAGVVTFPNATLATGRCATILPGPDLHRLERASFAWRTENRLTWASLRQGRDYRLTMAFPADISEQCPGLSPSLSWPCRTRTTSHSVGAHGSRTTIPLTAGRAQEARPFSKVGC